MCFVFNLVRGCFILKRVVTSARSCESLDSYKYNTSSHVERLRSVRMIARTCFQGSVAFEHSEITHSSDDDDDDDDVTPDGASYLLHVCYSKSHAQEDYI